MRVAAGDLPELLNAAAQAHQRMWASASRLTDADCRAPSLLPDWTRGHVLTHWARNADGQSRMLRAAMRGEVSTQYPGGDTQRAAEIEAGAARSGQEILDDARDALDRLERVWRRMPPEAWRRPTAARAGQRPAWVSVWARWRETEIHHVDLSAGYAHSDWPGEFVDLMLPRVMATLPGRVADAISVRVEMTDRDPAGQTQAVAEPGDDMVVVRGCASAALCWLLGRPVAANELTVTRSGMKWQLPGLSPWA